MAQIIIGESSVCVRDVRFDESEIDKKVGLIGFVDLRAGVAYLPAGQVMGGRLSRAGITGSEYSKAMEAYHHFEDEIKRGGYIRRHILDD